MIIIIITVLVLRTRTLAYTYILFYEYFLLQVSSSFEILLS